MASCVRLLFFAASLCSYSGHASSFIEVKCSPTNMGQVNHQSMLMCEVTPTQHIPDLKITVVVWRKTGIKEPISVFDARNVKPMYKNTPGYELADRTLNNRTVSLLITNTKVEHEGEYTCHVTTDIGFNQKTTSLKVTAKYNTPIVHSIDHKDSSNVHKTLICVASDGYPQGELRWFDENKSEWTKSATLTVNGTKNGLMALSSELPLLKASTFSEYTCVVYNASGGKEESATITTSIPNTDKVYELEIPSKVIAPIVVIGSLIVGLLMALLFVRRRSQQNRRPSTTPLMGTHHEVPHTDLDADERPDDGINSKTDIP